MAHDLLPWHVVYAQAQRGITAGVLENLAHDLHEVLRVSQGRPPQPSAAILDSRTLQSNPESGERAGYDGAKRKRGNKLHLAVDTLGHLLALCVTAANEQGRAQVEQLAARVQEVTSETVELAYVDQGYTGEQPAEDAVAHGRRLEVVTLPQTKRGFVLLPRRWVVSAVLCRRSFGWLSHFRRLARDYERLPETLSGLHSVAFVTLTLPRFIYLIACEGA